MRGTIKRVVPDKGFGFIRADGAQRGDPDLFFHRSGMIDGGDFDNLKEGDPVEYEESLSNKGPRAEQVARL